MTPGLCAYLPALLGRSAGGIRRALSTPAHIGTRRVLHELNRNDVVNDMPPVIF